MSNEEIKKMVKEGDVEGIAMLVLRSDPNAKIHIYRGSDGYPRMQVSTIVEATLGGENNK